MRFFSLKTCSTCRKALAALRAAGHAPNVIDVRAEGISAADRAAILASYGGAAINKSSTTWRQLSEAEKQGEPDELLAAYPTLLKRPAIEAGGTWTVGWGPQVQAQYLQNGVSGGA